MVAQLSNSATSTLNLALCTEWQIIFWFAEHQKINNISVGVVIGFEMDMALPEKTVCFGS